MSPKKLTTKICGEFIGWMNKIVVIREYLFTFITDIIHKATIDIKRFEIKWGGGK